MGFRQLSGRRWARQPLQAPPPRPRQRLHRSPRKLLRHQPRSGRPDRGRESTISKSALRGRWMRPGAAATALGGHRDPAGPRRAQSAALGSRHLLSFGTGGSRREQSCLLDACLAWRFGLPWSVPQGAGCAPCGAEAAAAASRWSQCGAAMAPRLPRWPRPDPLRSLCCLQGGGMEETASSAFAGGGFPPRLGPCLPSSCACALRCCACIWGSGETDEAPPCVCGSVI